ncbi:MAG: PEP-CTERM sorting domain-containing protein [Luteolibacter sp.]
MKPTKLLAITAITAALSGASSYGAVVITAVNSSTGYAISGAEVEGFRSTGVAKTYDIGTTPDNAYGTAGYLVFGGANSDLNGQGFSGASTAQSNPSFATIAAGAQFLSVSRNTGYSNYDNPSLAISTTVADFGASAIAIGNAKTGVGAWNELLTFTINGTAPSNFRLGIMAGNEGTADGRWDPTGLRVSFAGGTATAITGLPNFTGAGNTTGMVFFDIAVTGGSTGTFSIESQRRATNGGSSIAGITFDAVPEPSSSALLLGSLGILMFFRRRAA